MGGGLECQKDEIRKMSGVCECGRGGLRAAKEMRKRKIKV